MSEQSRPSEHVEKEASALGVGIGTATAFGLSMKSPQLMKMLGTAGREAAGKVISALRPKRNALHTIGRAVKNLSQGKDITPSERTMLQLGLGGTLAGGYAAAQLAKSIANAPKHNRVFANIIDSPSIPETEYGKAADLYSLIKKYAPSLASDAKVSGDLVSQMIRFEEVPPDFIQKLMEMEKKHQENRPGMLDVLPAVSKVVTGL